MPTPWTLLRAWLLTSALGCGSPPTPEAPPDPIAEAPNQADPLPARTDNQDAVDEALLRYKGHVQACYVSVTGAGLPVIGQLSLTWTVSDAGSAEDITVVQDTVGQERFTACLLGKLKRWGFPPAAKGPARQTWTFKDPAEVLGLEEAEPEPEPEAVGAEGEP